MASDTEAEVGLEQVVLGAASVFGNPVVVLDVGVLDLTDGHRLVGEQAGLDALGEQGLLGVEQGDLADLAG